MIVVRRGRARSLTRRSSEIDEMMRSLMSGHRSGTVRSLQVWRPAMDVYSTDDSFEIVAEIAGMRGEDIEVVVDGDVLVVRGVRERPIAHRCLSYYEARIPFGPFQAEVMIPFDIEWDETSADYQNGLLTVSLPRRRARTVEVRHASTAVEDESENDS